MFNLNILGEGPNSFMCDENVILIYQESKKAGQHL